MLKAITGNDTLTLWNRVFADFADGDISTLTFPNNTMELKTGKNKNTVYAKNETGYNAELVLRVIKASPDDLFLRQKLSELDADVASFVLADGEFVKRTGDGQGNTSREVYTLKGGAFTKQPDVKENVEGDTEQAVTIYTMKFASAKGSFA